MQSSLFLLFLLFVCFEITNATLCGVVHVSSPADVSVAISRLEDLVDTIILAKMPGTQVTDVPATSAKTVIVEAQADSLSLKDYTSTLESSWCTYALRWDVEWSYQTSVESVPDQSLWETILTEESTRVETTMSIFDGFLLTLLVTNSNAPVVSWDALLIQRVDSDLLISETLHRLDSLSVIVPDILSELQASATTIETAFNDNRDGSTSLMLSLVSHAQALLGMGDPETALRLLDLRLDLHKGDVDPSTREQVFVALLLKADCVSMLSESWSFSRIVQLLIAAHRVATYRVEPLLRLSQLYRQQEKYSLAYAYGRAAAALVDPMKVGSVWQKDEDGEMQEVQVNQDHPLLLSQTLSATFAIEEAAVSAFYLGSENSLLFAQDAYTTLLEQDSVRADTDQASRWKMSLQEVQKILKTIQAAKLIT